MWTTKNISTSKNLYNFSSSGQGSYVGTTISFDGKLVINLAEVIEDTQTEENVFQFLVCEDCGYTHCQPGNWVAIRQFGDIYLFIPAFEWIYEEEDSLKEEYYPPYYLKENGAIWMTSEKFEDFRSNVPNLRKKKNFKTLTKQEAIWLYKWDTPHQMFGKILELKKLNKEHISTVNIGNVDEMTTIIETKLKEIEKNDEFNLLPMTENDLIISFYLRDQKHTEWRALIENNGNIELLLGGQLILKNE